MNDELKTKEYLKPLAHIKLSDSSRERIKGDLLEYARFHAVVEGQANPPARRSPLRQWMFSPVPAALALVLLVGTTTSLLAKEAVPGDFLYAVKTSMNENFLGVFALGTKNVEPPAEPSPVQLADATKQQSETSDNPSDKDSKIHKNTKTDKTLAINNRTSALLENSEAAFAADVSTDLATKLSKGTISVGAYTSDVKLRDKTLRELVKKYDTKLESKVKTEFKTKLDSAGVLVVEAEGKSEADARAKLDKAAGLIAEVEAKLSTLGQVTVKDGIIVDVDFSVDLSVPSEEGEGAKEVIDTEVEGGVDATSGLGL